MEWTQPEKTKQTQVQSQNAPASPAGNNQSAGQKKVHISDLSIQQLQNVGSMYYHTVWTILYSPYIHY